MFLEYIYNRHVELLLKGMGKNLPNISVKTTTTNNSKVTHFLRPSPCGTLVSFRRTKLFIENKRANESAKKLIKMPYLLNLIETFLIDMNNYIYIYIFTSISTWICFRFWICYTKNVSLWHAVNLVLASRQTLKNIDKLLEFVLHVFHKFRRSPHPRK